MRAKQRLHAAIGAAVLISAAGASFFAGRASADGVPRMGALSYAGRLEGQDGPLTASKTIKVEIWDAATAGNLLCSASEALQVTQGAFRIQLPDACSAALAANATTYVAVSVDDVLVGARQKVGAVPYALEAARASAAVGDLDGRIGALERPSAFLARATTAQTVGNTQPVVTFEQELFDTGNEYDPATATFTPSTAGVYDIGCNVFFGAPAGSPPIYLEAGVFVNGMRTDVAGRISNGQFDMFRARSLVPLAAGDEVTCRGYAATASFPLAGPRPGEAVSSFSAHRVGD